MGVAIHAISHLTCDFPRLIHADPIKYAPMIQYFGYQPKSYWHFVKSFEGISGIIMIVLMAIAFTLASPWFRRSRINLPKPLKKLTGFNAFWYSHHLFVIVYTLLIIHGIKLYLSHKWYKKTVSLLIDSFFIDRVYLWSYDDMIRLRMKYASLHCVWQMQTWMYLAVPVLLYVGERLIRAFRSSIKPVQILKVSIFPLLFSFFGFFFFANLIQSTNLTYQFRIGIWRWLSIREMYWRFTCQSLRDSSTRVGNTCLSIVLLFHHLNGNNKAFTVLFFFWPNQLDCSIEDHKKGKRKSRLFNR